MSGEHSKIDEAQARQSQSKQVFHTSSCYSPYILEYVHHQHPNPQPSGYVALTSHSPARWIVPQLFTPAPSSYKQQPPGPSQIQQQFFAQKLLQRETREHHKAITVNSVVP
jgi:hypothetical protein